jgi:hypothetical protein
MDLAMRVVDVDDFARTPLAMHFDEPLARLAKS